MGEDAYNELYDICVAQATAAGLPIRVRVLAKLPRLVSISFWVNVFATLLGPSFFYMDKCLLIILNY